MIEVGSWKPSIHLFAFLRDFRVPPFTIFVRFAVFAFGSSLLLWHF